ncbi:class I SAM-dependent methyltransferase [Haloarcula argentinensis]|uniref:Methyltransferase domain-containing protein n=1 Tax=Haloarcula argentinensis TaxID=43776 RepID=A0ABU2F4Q0_HALAR|nr:methyltransferase domain-containing protein [Haloarcula argentinensis]EMA26362.1 type 11 methyltransferase [Haloarcula argentinensis DSM 12282]MDS0255543.1 methyltransferase domain-containing protein [Haloarcula argentinensis]
MVSKSRWHEAQQAETEFHQEISRGDQELRWIDEQFDSSRDILDGRVLEVGCGTGGLTYSVADSVSEVQLVVGVDPVFGKLSNPALSTEPVVQAAGESLPFEDSSFDVVASLNVIDHAIRPSAILDEISRVLKTNGTFLFKINTFSLPKFVRKRMKYVDRPHLHHFSPSEVRDDLADHGFRITHEYVNSRELFGRRLGDWDLKWIIATTALRLNTHYMKCVID